VWLEFTCGKVKPQQEDSPLFTGSVLRQLRDECAGKIGGVPGDRFRPAGQDDSPRLELPDRFRFDIPGMDLAVHADLADPARDQPVVLGAEIQDQDPVGMNIVMGRHGCLSKLVDDEGRVTQLHES